jgi:hypothetical protein
VYGFDCELTGYVCRWPAEGCPDSDKREARMLVESYLAKAPGQLVKQELARLRVSTKSRHETDDDLAMGFQVLGEECAKYPPDVVVWALRGWAQMETFYPSLAEIRDRLQRGVKRRKSLMEAIS